MPGKSWTTKWNAVIDYLATIAGAISSSKMQVGTLPAGTNLIGKFGIDQATANANEVVVKSITAGDANIGNVDIVTLPSGNLGDQAKAASLSVTPATDITDGRYIGDIKFGESLPAGTDILGKTGIDQTTDGTTNHVHVHGLGASAIEVENVTLTVVDTEYNYTIPANCKSIEFWSRGGYPVRWEFTTGHVATPSGDYLTLKSNCSYSSPPALNLSSKTIYFASDNAGDVVEIVAWS